MGLELPLLQNILYILCSMSNASLSAFTFSRIPFHHKDETESDIFLLFSRPSLLSQTVFYPSSLTPHIFIFSLIPIFCFYILFHSCNSHHITCGASLFFTFGEGIPAVITTISPVSTNCFTFASSIAPSQMSSVVLNACDLIGFTPQ